MATVRKVSKTPDQHKIDTMLSIDNLLQVLVFVEVLQLIIMIFGG